MREFLNSCLNRARRLIPGQCLLCGAGLDPPGARPAAEAPVCKGCSGDLPWLPAQRCDVCAAPLPAGTVCGACLAHPPRFSRVTAAFLYAYPVDALVQAFKYGGDLALADPLAAWLAACITRPADLVVSMPLAPSRQRQRGFNQAHELARRVARHLGAELAGDVCRKVLDTAPQAALPWTARAANVRGVFVCDADLCGLDVAVVDDVMTTGATLNELARTLHRAGAASVAAWVVARAARRGAHP